MLVSGNREVIEDENTGIEQATPTAAVEEKKDIPFKKPVMLQEKMKTTSIKEVLEKHQVQRNEEKTVSTEETISVEEPATAEKNQEIQTTKPLFEVSTQENTLEEQQIVFSEEQQEMYTENDSEETSETVFFTLQDCWEKAIKEAATDDMMIAEELLLKQVPTANEENIIEVKVLNEVAKQEVRQILPTLNQCLFQKTGIPYSIEIKLVKVEQEKQLDKTNPDEKFKHLCQENPNLLEFKQRLNLSIS